MIKMERITYWILIATFTIILILNIGNSMSSILSFAISFFSIMTIIMALHNMILEKVEELNKKEDEKGDD